MLGQREEGRRKLAEAVDAGLRQLPELMEGSGLRQRTIEAAWMDCALLTALLRKEGQEELADEKLAQAGVGVAEAELVAQDQLENIGISESFVRDFWCLVSYPSCHVCQRRRRWRRGRQRAEFQRNGRSDRSGSGLRSCATIARSTRIARPPSPSKIH